MQNSSSEDCPQWLRETLIGPRYEQIEDGTLDTWTGEVWLESYDEPVKAVEPGTAAGWTVGDLVDMDEAYLDGLVSGDEYEHILKRRTS